MKTKAVVLFILMLTIVITIFNSSRAISDTTDEVVVQDLAQSMQQ